MTPEQITQIYSFYFLTTPILVRLIVFNFIFKEHKHFMVILLDSIVLISTAIWLILIRDVILPLPSVTLNASIVLYIILIIDIVFNFKKFKKAKALN
ncbi:MULTISPECIES: hypothetical protein [unclassified Lysinibacillus]|uniref:hypothetical protein n=1 Tax=unclassified Lysinibacillus TaxID=2636778 RepID=UPI00201B38EF|nr:MULTISPECIES: hypothetical protein [unclassified Lysinibacillus]